MNKRKAYFRADASSEIGYGHFIRSLALADMLKDDFDCTFFTQSPTGYQQKEVAKVCKLVSLPADDSRFKLFLDKISGDEIVILDNYFFTTDYQQRIKEKGCKLVCIDDMHDKHFVADAVINHSLGIKNSDYSKEEYTQLYLGLEYVLLRLPFIEACKNTISRKKKDRIKVFVSFGGADKYGIAESISSELNKLDAIEKIFLVSPHNSNIVFGEKISRLSSLSAEQMKEFLSHCDLAIIPSSTIMKEAIACGIDIIGGYFINNQINSYHQFCNINAIIGFGNLSEINNQKLLINFIKEKKYYNLTLRKNLIPPNLVNNIINIFRKL